MGMKGPLMLRELHALDRPDEVLSTELALREERDDLEHGVGEATDVQHVVAVADLRRPVRLKIDEHRTLGVATAEDTGALMVKQIGSRPWPDGVVDLLGHLFLLGYTGLYCWREDSDLAPG